MMNQDQLQTDKEQLENILSRVEYTAYLKENSRNPLAEWLSKLWQKLMGLFSDTPVPAGASKLVAYIVVSVLLAALVAAIVWLVRSMLLVRFDKKRGLFRSEDELGQTSEALLLEADRHASADNYAEAVRFSFLGMLLLLDEQGWVRTEKWKTNLEYAEELIDSQPSALPSFTVAARLFEQVYYGRRNAEAADYNHMLTLLTPYRGEVAAHD
ncbi:DUF4129 domain-containing protein [Paenibacillaceae bacterium]|nr:DUF4129 domain-containing protein [Paenibacillaceae bacterium]